jgi:hypothetical protein
LLLTSLSLPLSSESAESLISDAPLSLPSSPLLLPLLSSGDRRA